MTKPEDIDNDAFEEYEHDRERKLKRRIFLHVPIAVAGQVVFWAIGGLLLDLKNEPVLTPGKYVLAGACAISFTAVSLVFVAVVKWKRGE